MTVASVQRWCVAGAQTSVLGPAFLTHSTMINYYDRFFHRRCRRQIPKPSVLAARLERVVCYGRSLKMADGRPLFRAGKGGMEATHRNVLKEVRRGHVSDSPDIELYRVIKRNERGWNVYSVARGSSALEGFHLHVRTPVPSCLPSTHAVIVFLPSAVRLVCVHSCEQHYKASALVRSCATAFSSSSSSG